MKNKVACEILKVLEDIGEKDYISLISLVSQAKRVFVAGSGRSGLIGKCFAMRLMHMGIETHVAGETICPPVKKGDLLIVVSFSGERKSLLEFAKIARGLQAKVLLITGAKPPRKGVFDYVVKIPAEKSVQFKNSLFEQAAFLFLEIFVERYRKKHDISLKEMMSRHANLE